MVNNSKHVIIDYKKLDSFIENIYCKILKHWLSNNPYNLFDIDVVTMINMMLLFEAINYSFWGNLKWTIDTEKGKKYGSDALLYIMIKYAKKENNAKNIKYMQLDMDNINQIEKNSIL